MALSRDICPGLRSGVKLESLPLSPQEGYVLSLINGLTTVGQIISLCGLPESDVENILEKLEQLKVVEFHQIQTAARKSKSIAAPLPRAEVKQGTVDLGMTLRRLELMYKTLDRQDHYQLLGVPKTASENDIKEAYAALSREFHPDRFFKMDLGTRKPMVDTVFARISEAFDTLRTPSKRVPYDKSLLPAGSQAGAGGAKAPPARKSFASDSKRIADLGEQEIRAGNFSGALQNFKLAAAMSPGDQDLVAKTVFVESLQGLLTSVEKVNNDPSAAAVLGTKLINPILNHIRRDKALFPADEKIISTLVTFLLQFDATPELAQVLIDKISKRALRPVNVVLIGRVYEKSGKESEALRQYERALAADANCAQAKDAITNLKRKR